MSDDRVNEKSEAGIAQHGEGLKRRDLLLSGTSLMAASALLGASVATTAQAQQPAPATTPPAAQQPNIVFIMGDDIGMWNIGAYHRGLMAGRTPNIDKLAAEGMLFTGDYAEASGAAGRAQFITGELPIRTGMTTVGQAGSPIGIPPQAATIATVLKSMGYATGHPARTISAISTSSCRPCTASTNSSATSITSTPWKTRRIPPIRRNC